MSTPEQPTNLNHTGLIDAVARESGVRRADVKAVLRAFFDVTGRALATGHKVRITNFGTLYRRVYKTTHNPKTLEATGPSASVGFRATGALSRWVKAGVPADTLAKAAKTWTTPKDAPTRDEFEFFG